MNRNDFVGRLLKTGDAELVQSYFVGHPLTIEEMKEMLNSQYSEVFVEYIHSRLFNQQAEPVDVDAATEDTTSVAEDALASEAPAPVAPVDEAPASETETQVELPAYLFHRIAIEELVGKSGISSDAKKVLNRVIKLMKEKAGLVFWGELFTCRNRVERFLNLDNKSDFDYFTRNFEREMGPLDAQFPGLDDALKPYLEAYAQEQAEMAVQSEAKREEEQRVSKRALVEELLDTKIGDLRECERIMNKASVGCKKSLSHFVNDALISSEDSMLRFMMEYRLRDALNETEVTLKKWMGTSERVNALKECIEVIKELGV